MWQIGHDSSILLRGQDWARVGGGALAGIGFAPADIALSVKGSGIIGSFETVFGVQRCRAVRFGPANHRHHLASGDYLPGSRARR